MAIDQDIYDEVITGGGAVSITTAGYYRIEPDDTDYTTLSVASDVDAGTEIDIGPEVTFTGAWDLDGDKTTIHMGPGIDVQGLTTVDGASVSLIGKGSGGTAGIVVNATEFCLNGGGKGFLVAGGSTHALRMETGATRYLIENLSVSTASGTSFGFSSAVGDGVGIVNAVKVTASSSHGFSYSAGDVIMTCCVSNAHAAYAISHNTNVPRLIVYASHFGRNSSTDGLHIKGDDSIFVGLENTADSATFATRVDSAADNCIVVGNRLEVAVTEIGTPNTVANNEIGAF